MPNISLPPQKDYTSLMSRKKWTKPKIKRIERELKILPDSALLHISSIQESSSTDTGTVQYLPLTKKIIEKNVAPRQV
jgi:hypothetical protein